MCALHELAATAEFSNKEESIWDRLVLAVLDTELSEKLQLKPDLTLEGAVQEARQYELVKVTALRTAAVKYGCTTGQKRRR